MIEHTRELRAENKQSRGIVGQRDEKWRTEGGKETLDETTTTRGGRESLFMNMRLGSSFQTRVAHKHTS